MVPSADVGIGSGHSAVADVEQGGACPIPHGLAHLPSGRFAPELRRGDLRGDYHNLLDAAGALTNNPAPTRSPRRGKASRPAALTYPTPHTMINF